MRVLGLDPGLRVTGWGIIEADGNRLAHVADGTIATSGDDLARRLTQVYEGVAAVIQRYGPAEAAVEETFVNKNPGSTLKLGQARGAAILAPARAGLPVVEYAPNLIKKSVVGAGHAAKMQVQHMIAILLPGFRPRAADAADALAVAICHAHHRASGERVRAGAALTRTAAGAAGRRA
jgi:crossover junction endodeoxyribonuclease RuvC